MAGAHCGDEEVQSQEPHLGVRCQRLCKLHQPGLHSYVHIMHTYACTRAYTYTENTRAYTYTQMQVPLGMWMGVEGLQHPHIVNLMGVCVNPPSLGIVLEYCPNGSLQEVLSQRRYRVRVCVLSCVFCLLAARVCAACLCARVLCGCLCGVSERVCAL